MLEDLHAPFNAILITYNLLGAEAYARKVSISSFNTYIDMAAPLNGLIFDAVYGGWLLSLLLFTFGIIV